MTALGGNRAPSCWSSDVSLPAPSINRGDEAQNSSPNVVCTDGSGLGLSSASMVYIAMSRIDACSWVVLLLLREREAEAMDILLSVLTSMSVSRCAGTVLDEKESSMTLLSGVTVIRPREEEADADAEIRGEENSDVVTTAAGEEEEEDVDSKAGGVGIPNVLMVWHPASPGVRRSRSP